MLITLLTASLIIVPLSTNWLPNTSLLGLLYIISMKENPE